MRRTPRFLAVMLLALVMPLQGLAAVAAGQCMALEHHQDPAAVHGDHAHEHDAAGAHDHPSDAGTSAAQDDPGDNAAHCGPCTACCASASIAGSLAYPIFAASNEAPYVASPSSPPGIEPHGVFRPPLAL
jgi:hypothetical protein